ncbi:MAG: aldehyde dehydrogenase family protein [Robiginitalea sp.]|jgi:aldehyde dehydrogenase (NAD+)
MNGNANPYQGLFQQQMGRYLEVGQHSRKERLYKLKALSKALEHTYRQPIREALYSDFKKPFIETDLTEIYPVLAEIRHTERNLQDWLRPRRVNSPLTMIGSRSFIQYESKGVCLILSPWNFPVNLTFGPLVSAIAAGNCCILKPSEATPATSQLMQRIIEDLFDPAEIALVQGEVATAQALLELPFHHIFFTGSPAVGKLVMAAASRHLSSVTLELGGKSPAFVDETAEVETAAKRLAWGKCLNAGQICVAPDYILVTENAREALVKALIDQLDGFFQGKAESSDSYARIINDKHLHRLSESLRDATARGAQILYGGAVDQTTRFFEPTLLEEVPEDARLLEEEIFGPILPIVTVSGVEEAISFINRRERPLALYIYSKDKRTIRELNTKTRAGSGCINHNVVHYSNHNLPFGGINNSGAGKSHGYYGFLEFSNQRSIVRQYTPSTIEFLMPPYTGFKQKIVDATLRWFK